MEKRKPLGRRKVIPKPSEVHVVEVEIISLRSYIYGMTTDMGVGAIMFRKAADAIVKNHLRSHHWSEVRGDPYGDDYRLEVWAQKDPDGGHFDTLHLYAVIEMWSQDNITREQALKM